MGQIAWAEHIEKNGMLRAMATFSASVQKNL
ncbi:MAG: hypothetical protein RL341_246 [Pseudomonadota bacterium]|jgi:hypothetical protein